VDAWGIDLTQHRTHVYACTGPGTDSCVDRRGPTCGLPVALLPLHQEETPICGSGAWHHRRGTGGRWPPEAQAPVGGDPTNGVGRVPLVLAWSALTLSGTGSDAWGQLGNTTCSWQPTDADPGARRNRIGVSAERLLAQATSSETDDHDAAVALVVPDALSEAAQQALLDELAVVGVSDATLVPRPACLALAWCRQNEHAFQDRGTTDDEGEPVGFLRVITLAMDAWESAALEIRARRHAGRTWLVPIRHRPGKGSETGWWGIDTALAAASTDHHTAAEVWRLLFAEEYVDGMLKNVSESFRTAIETCAGARDASARFGDWGNFRWLATRERPSAGMLASIRSNLDKDIEQLPGGSRTPLGIVVDGSYAVFRMSEHARLSTYIANNQGRYVGAELAGGGELAARGAALAVWAIKNGMPSYRDALTPVDIYYAGKDDKGDPTANWRPLVECATVEAGHPHQSPEVRGLVIPEGAHELRLCLRRPMLGASFAFRDAGARADAAVSHDERVVIRAAVRPGQGFARVAITSEHAGVFRALLNWKTMQECSEPRPPKLSYLPTICSIVGEQRLWQAAAPLIRKALTALERHAQELRTPRLGTDSDERLVLAMRGLLAELRRSPMADYVDGVRPDQRDMYRFYAVFGADGRPDAVADEGLCDRLRRALDAVFGLTLTVRSRTVIQRTASWMYLSVPPGIARYVRREFERHRSSVRSVDVHSAGLTWHSPTDLNLFYQVLAEALAGQAKPNEWLRGLRNIVRLREHALAPGATDRDTLDAVVASVLKIAEGEIRIRSLKQKLSNCVTAFTFLLKRRRYEPDFVEPDSPAGRRFAKLLAFVGSSKTASRRCSEMAKSALNFLAREASEDDVRRTLCECDDEEAESDDDS
jgi:hypothetical protein